MEKSLGGFRLGASTSVPRRDGARQITEAGMVWAGHRGGRESGAPPRRTWRGRATEADGSWARHRRAPTSVVAFGVVRDDRGGLLP
ncbi:MAG: hypothetical protein AAF791_09275 [Bacteroidota bacterium]